jgi:RHS repeat-associated protein
MDNEVCGDGNWQDYGERMYSPRLGRFPSVDPLAKKFPMLSTYQYASLNPIMNIDLDGLEGVQSITGQLWKSAGITTATATQIEKKVVDGILKAGRLSQDALVITGGVLTIAASGGAALPIAMGVVATGGGATKFYFNAKGNYDKADATPTTISGTVMVTANYMVGEEVFSQTFQATVSFIEGAATLDLKNLKVPNVTNATNEAVSLMNLAIDASSIPSNMKNLLTPNLVNPTTPKNQSAAPADATSVETPTPVIGELKPVETKKPSGTSGTTTTTGTGG